MASFDSSSSSDSVSGDHNWACGGGDDLSYSDRERAEKFFLPIASVTRIMRIGVPKNWKITNDAKDAMQESVSEFISFITSEASCKCKRENRKTITGDDVLWAMSVLGFEDYMEPLKVYLAKYRKMEVFHARSGHTKKHINS